MVSAEAGRIMVWVWCRGELTKLGRRMAEFPLDPMMAKAILAAEKYEARLPIRLNNPTNSSRTYIHACIHT